MVSTQFIAPSLSDNRVKPQAAVLGCPIDGRFTLATMRERARTDFGQRLVEARAHAKLSQVELAKAVGMSQGTLGELEMDGEGSTYTVKIATACGVRPEWLAEGEGEMLDYFAWPFKKIDRDVILTLDDEDLAMVEGAVLNALMHTKKPTKEALSRMTQAHRTDRKRASRNRSA